MTYSIRQTKRTFGNKTLAALIAAMAMAMCAPPPGVYASATAPGQPAANPAAASAPTPAAAQADVAAKLAQLVQWQTGPGMADLGDKAQVQIPQGGVFTGGDGARKILEMMHNPTSGNELGLMAPRDMGWFLVFEFDDVGYVKDEDKTDLDADALLKKMKAGNEYANKERKERGWDTVEIVGWDTPPHYDEKTHNLEWAIRGKSSEDDVVNYNVRVLGREGVMEVSLVSDPKQLPTLVPYMKLLLGTFSYKEGHRYAEYRQGDKLAAYGLSALIVGGAAAVGVKSGAFKALWKLIILGIAVIGSLFAKIAKFFGKK